ncbi:MAG: glycosyltransferase family 4 protein [Armatimonadetes bacterium]|nr:glycosyltransferase family 4 protein [Armatimonadota bacterium]
MRILMKTRKEALEHPGGDTVQMLRLKEELEKRGHFPTVSTYGEDDLKKYDLVHFFNLFDSSQHRETLSRCRAAGVPWVTTPNFWDPDEYLHACSPSVFLSALRALLGMRTSFALVRPFLPPPPSAEIELLRGSRIIFPNSSEEKRQLMHLHKVPEERFVVVPNGVDAHLFAPGETGSFEKEHGVKDFVLCCGRVEDRKNQLALIRGMRGIPVPLVLIGDPAPYQPEYLEKCRKEAGTLFKALFLPALPQNELVPAYSAARVHVLPSWWENTGLVSLEAALCGCEVVTTDRSPVREYLGDHAYTCDPSSPDSIKSAIRQALAGSRSKHARERIKSCFSWPRSAEILSQGYRMALEGGNP